MCYNLKYVNKSTLLIHTGNKFCGYFGISILSYMCIIVI